MNERYQSRAMKDLWSLENRYLTFLKVEQSVVKAYNHQGLVPNDDLDKILKLNKIDLNRILELEQETKHDVVAFTRSLSEQLGEEAKWIHYSLTSTDVVDTANSLLLKEANEIILNCWNQLLETLKKLAYQYKDLPTIGRTHGIHAEITSFGLKFALYYDELKRAQKNFLLAKEDVEVAKISGAVGNYANVDPSIQDFVASDLGLKGANISTQVLSRDRYSAYIFSLSLMGSILEQIATEIRSLSRTEISEVREKFSAGQKGSSAMPHKKNPVSAENICGLARVLRGYNLTASENINLWGERDISHSSAERIVFEDAISLAEYILKRMNNLLTNLYVDQNRVLENINLTHGNIFSQRVLNALIEKGLTREKAYDLIQPLTFEVGKDKGLKEVLKDNQEVVKYLSNDEIDECFNYDYYLKNVGYILDKVIK